MAKPGLAAAEISPLPDMLPSPHLFFCCGQVIDREN